uniref:Retrovirus-related Pol polyprotein from transposon 17.6 n=1 Tax=Vitis vinifera TaxID=29760 RepID=A5AHN2_VITVI|nr:hypothetical protein VITISV_026520 [Vitis vinifera]
MDRENPYQHIKEFEEVCNTFREGGASIDLMRLKLFPFTLKDKAKVWLNSLRPKSIRSWNDLQPEFLKKFFSTHRTNGLKRQISNFSAKENEKFYEYWERYMEAINAFPHHGFDTWLLVSYFYDGKVNALIMQEMTNRDRRMDRTHNDLSQKIDNLQYQISRLTNLNTVQEKGKFPSQPHQNPKAIHEVEAQEGESSQMREFKAVITLRSGKEVDLHTPKPEQKPEQEPEQELETEVENEKREENKGKKIGSSTKKADLEAKDLYTIKRGLNVSKKAFLTEQVSSIIQCKSLVKYKDSGCPSISVMIGETCVEKALLDLGASVNLLPYSVYKQLGLGELNPISITLSLVDRSVKIPRGMIKDVLVQVDKFYYPVDFFVLDMDPVTKGTNYIPIILGRPFLTTSNAIINYSPWVSPTQVVPKKSGITVVQNDKGEEVSTRLTSGIFQIEIAIEDQEKTTFTCPFEIYAYKRMSFGLCNAPATFQRCMLSIFIDMVERIMEVFMDDITVYGTVLNRCIEKDLVLNWEKCHFMVPQGIVLGHIISSQGIEVDKAKVALIFKLPSPTTIKRMMCDAGDFAIGVVLGKIEDGKPYVIYYASKTLNEEQRNYTTAKKELLAVVFALDKFRAYLIKDKKGVENVVADHLSRLAIAHTSHNLPINDDFPEESLMLIEAAPWYVHIANYLVIGEVPRSQESNASNRVRFGAEMRKIWPLEDNCAKLVRNSHNTFSLCELVRSLCELVRSLCETRTTPSACAKLAQHSHNIFTAHAWCKFSSVPPTPREIFSFRYFCINFLSSPCNPPIIRFLS